MITFRVDKKAFDEIQEQRKIVVMDGKRKMEFTPDKVSKLAADFFC